MGDAPEELTIQQLIDANHLCQQRIFQQEIEIHRLRAAIAGLYNEALDREELEVLVLAQRERIEALQSAESSLAQAKERVTKLENLLRQISLANRLAGYFNADFAAELDTALTAAGKE